MLSGVILAGGVGSRMGTEKGLVSICSRPMVVSVFDAVSRVADEVFIAVGSGRGHMYSGMLGRKARILEDSTAGRGPLEGLANAFNLARGEYVVVAPCDAPFLRSEVLEALRARALGSEGAVPVVRGYLEPLVAVYRREAALRAFQSELAEGRGKVGDALSRMTLNLVEERELRMLDADLLSFWNINSPDDLLRAKRLMSNGAVRP